MLPLSTSAAMALWPQHRFIQHSLDDVLGFRCEVISLSAACMQQVVLRYVFVMLFFFFFQAEDGIRDYKVTGVQTCALPIWELLLRIAVLRLSDRNNSS